MNVCVFVCIYINKDNFLSSLAKYFKILNTLITARQVSQLWLYVLTFTDPDYADYIAIQANTPNQAETLLHSLERAVAGISLHVNAHKTEYMCFN